MTDESNRNAATAGAARTTASNGSDKAGAAQVRAESGAAGGTAANRVKFDTTQLKSSYCNVCNGSSTREEVVLNFGVNSNWDLGVADRLEVALLHRIVMSPHAAKRVRDMMIRLIDEHEARHGKLDP